VKVGVTAVVGLVGMTAAAAALADEAPRFSRVTLLLPTCEQPGLAPSVLRSALSLDLRDQGLLLAPPGEASAGDVLVRIEAACSADAELTLQVELQHETRTRHIDLSELPPAQRARALSLSLAELLSQLDPARTPLAHADDAAGEAQPVPEAASSLEPAASAKAPAPNPAKVAKPRLGALVPPTPERALPATLQKERKPSADGVVSGHCRRQTAVLAT